GELRESSDKGGRVGAAGDGDEEVLAGPWGSRCVERGGEDAEEDGGGGHGRGDGNTSGGERPWRRGGSNHSSKPITCAEPYRYSAAAVVSLSRQSNDSGAIRLPKAMSADARPACISAQLWSLASSHRTRHPTSTG